MKKSLNAKIPNMKKQAQRHMMTLSQIPLTAACYKQEQFLGLVGAASVGKLSIRKMLSGRMLRHISTQLLK